MQAGQSTPGFRLLEHTADIGIDAWGPTLDSLFEQAALGLRHLLVGTSPVAHSQKHPVQLDAGDAGELMVAWLNEIIFLFETHNLVPGTFQIEWISREELRAVIHMETYTATQHTVEHQVKAATYHQLSLGQEREGWRARIYLDL